MEAQISLSMKRYNHLTCEIEAAYHEAALKLGLSDSAMLILYTICDHGESCLLGDISRLSGISKQTINSSLRKLEGDGIVLLEAAGGKAKRICLTQKGKTLARDTVCKVIEIENRIFNAWSEEERTVYLELTQRYLTEFREEIKGV